MAVNRVIDYIQAYSHYRESASDAAGYGDGFEVAQGSIDKLKSIGTGRLLARVADRWDNAAAAGKGHEFAGSSENRTWLTDGQVGGEADTDLLGMLLLITLGGLNTGTPSGGTNSRDHVFTPQEPSSGLQLPSTSMIARDHSSLDYYRYAGLVGAQITLKGGQNQYVNCDCTLQGNGRRAVAAAYSPPSYAAHRLLRDAISTFKFGTPGGELTDYTAAVKSWELTWNNNLIAGNAHYPRGTTGLYTTTTRSSGMVAGRMEFGSRVCDFKATILLESAASRTLLEGNTAQEIEIISEGDLIETGFYDKLTVSLKDVRFRAVSVGDADGLATYEIEGHVHMPSSGLWADLLTVTLRNSVAAYGSLQS